MPGGGWLRGGRLSWSGKPGLGLDLGERIAEKYPLTDDYHSVDWTTVRGMDGSLVRS